MIVGKFQWSTCGDELTTGRNKGIPYKPRQFSVPSWRLKEAKQTDTSPYAAVQVVQTSSCGCYEKPDCIDGAAWDS